MPGGLDHLLQPMAGLVGELHTEHAASDEPRLTTTIVQAGTVLPEWFDRVGRPQHTIRSISGVGVGLSADESMLPCLGEALERYCTSVFHQDQFLWATAKELGAESLDLSRIACSSSRELSDPKCPLLAPDPAARIRWVKGVCLTDGQVAYLPVTMVYLHAGYASSGERFWLPITTGCAAHVTYARAMLLGLFEVIEREAISVTWLQRLNLPRIVVDTVGPVLAPYWNAYQNSSAGIEYIFFDATSDLGVPTVYALQVRKRDRRVRTLVACSSAVSLEAALAKVIRDMAATSVAFRINRPVPDKREDFSSVFHGATYMARAEQASAFDFLLQGGKTTLLSESKSLPSGSDECLLHLVLDRLQQLGIRVYAADLSTDEAIRSGMRVVHILVPQLQPLSFSYRARFLGNPRLYEIPLAFNSPVYEEADLNPWPQPFS